MARRRTRRGRQAIPRIGTAPGQRGELLIEPSELIINREPDRVILHDQGRTQTRTLAGNQHHIYLHPEQRERPQPERPRPFFNFEELGASLQERVEKRVAREKIVPGAKTPKYAGKWPGVAINLANPRNVIRDKSYAIHPVMFVDAIVSTKRGGIIRLWRDKRAYRKAMRLNERFGPRAAQIIEDFRAEANAALAELQRLVAEGRINRENRNFEFGKYEKAVHEAEVKFQVEKTRLINDYMKEWKGRKAA